MRLNSIRPLPAASLRRRGEAIRDADWTASPAHIRARTVRDVRVVGVSGAGKSVNETLRAARVLAGSRAAVRVSIVAKEHGKAVRVKGDRKVKA